jgi:ribosomal protein S18 acetylase RimI-like enzyme
MVIADARERGAASVRLSVQVDNAAARRLYQRLGFVADPAPDEAEAVAAFVEMHRPL